MLKLNNFDQNALNNNFDVKNKINILFHYLKILIGIALGILTNKTCTGHQLNIYVPLCGMV